VPAPEVPGKFVVVRSHDEAWNPRREMREQPAWDEHARFMNDLASEGFIVLGGPVGDGAKTLLIIEAESAEAIRQRLAADPWSAMKLLKIESIEPWNVLLARPDR
jgi:uncharacterized protein YciI